MPNNMKLIMENWNRFLINEQDPMDQINKDLKSADDTLERVKEIADKKGIKSYSYVNGKIGGVKLTKDEIEYIETGKQKESSIDFAVLNSLYSKRSVMLFKFGEEKKKKKEFKFASIIKTIALSLSIFSLLDPLRGNKTSKIKDLKSSVIGYMQQAKIEETKQNKVLELINKAINNSVAIYEDEQIAKVLGLTGFSGTLKIYEKSASKK